MTRSVLAITLLVLGFVAAINAQSPAPGVPRFVPAFGVLVDHGGKPLNGSNVKVTFSVYANAHDVDALWSETLKLQVTAGRYDALIGSSSIDGIPSTVFAAGEPRWLGVTADKAAASPRSLLVSVPYALTADDSSKLGGLPAAAFVLKEDAGIHATASSTPSGWKQAVVEEMTARAEADSALQNNLDSEAASRATADSTLQNSLEAEQAARETRDVELEAKLDDTAGELTGKIDAAKTELHSKIELTKGDLHSKIDLTKSELDSKIDATKQELNSKIAFETTKVTTEQDAKLLALKNELKQDSSLKVDDLDQKKTGKEEFEFEKGKKGQEIEELKTKKLSKDEYLLEKQSKDADITELKQKKVEKTDFDADKTSKQQQIDVINAKLNIEKGRVDTLARFVVSFAREPNGNPMQNHWMCPEGTIAIGIVGQTADPLATASPFCSPVTGASVRADGSLAASFNGPFAVPGFDGAVPTYELMCPAAYAVVGIAVDDEGNMSARCRRVFSAIEVNSAASVPVPALPPGPSCPADQTAAGIVRFAASIEAVCR